MRIHKLISWRPFSCFHRILPEDYQDCEFDIRVKMKSRWVPHFLALLKYMEQLGGLGSSRTVSFYSDGDGDYRPRFRWSSSLPKPARHKTDDDGDRFFDAG